MSVATKTRKTTKNTSKKTIGQKAKEIKAKLTKTKAPKVERKFLGRIEATQVFRRDMPEFKNCKAEMYLLINERANTATYANAYNGLLKSSYDPKTYTYEYKEKVVAKKKEEMEELDVTDWPEWIVNIKRSKK